jgi:hypothetical protein
VSDVELYHEIQGSGPPLVLLHGALSTIETSFGAVMPLLAESRRVIPSSRHTATLRTQSGR